MSDLHNDVPARYPGDEFMAQHRARQRQRFWRGIRYRAARPVMRLLCVPRHHRRWGHQSMIHAFATGDSKRCRWCNRLVFKKEFRP